MNKITSNYFRNMFLRKKKLLILYTFVCFMAYPFIMFTNRLTEKGNGAEEITIVAFILSLFVLGAFAIVLPVFTFKFSLTKRNVDTYYSIPINRDHLFKAHFIAPAVGVCIPILVNYLIGGLMVLPSVGFGTYVQLLLCLLLAFAVFVLIYSINTFFVLKCNNVLDACIISAVVAILPLFVYMALNVFLYSQTVDNGMVSIGGVPELVLKLLSPYYGLAIVGGIPNSALVVDFSSAEWLMLLYYLVIGLTAAAGAYRTFKKKKGESAEQLTTDIIIYPLLSNIALASLMLCFNLMSNDLTTSILIVVALFVVFFIINGIAKRSMKLTPFMVAEFIILIVCINGFNYISRQTEFFGLNRQVVDYMNYDFVDFSLYSFIDEKEEYNVRIEINDLDDNDKALFEHLIELQKQASLDFKEFGDYNGAFDDAQLSITYERKGKERDIIWVYFYLNEEESKTVGELLKACMEE